MKSIDWSTFTLKININAPEESILAAWSSQDELEKWFLSKAEFFDGDELIERNHSVQKGNTYKWMWHTVDVVAEGQILELGEDSLDFTFEGCNVRVSVHQKANENILVLTQSAIPTDDESKIATHMGCTRGWIFYMTNLKSVLEGGLDLRNKNDLIKNMIST